LLVAILDGRGTDMPSFGDKLSEDSARALVAFLRDAAPKPAAEVQTSPDAFAQRFAELQTELQELQRQFHALARPAPKGP
jgi:hypothetical protein